MSLIGIRLRNQVTQSIRETLIQQGYEEYITQLMDKAQPLEPSIYPFSTNWDNHQSSQIQLTPLYFATSPEKYLKQVLAINGKKSFALSHAFRNAEGQGPYHNPEFLMVEWYTLNTNWHEAIKQTQQVVTSVWNQQSSQTKFDTTSWKKISIKSEWLKQFQVDLDSLMTNTAMKEFAKNHNCNPDNATWEQLFYQLIFNYLEPHFPTHPFFLVDFPSQVSPLAKPQKESPQYCERFELFIQKIEIANGNTENTDTKSIQTMMQKEQQLRQRKPNTPPIDDDFLLAIDKLKTQSWSGVGLGVDRLTMLIGNITSIKDVQWI